MKNLLLAGCAAVVLLAGCSSTDSRADPKVLNRRPIAYQPESFDDLGLELLRGYRLAADHEPLAVAYAGGDLRRFDVVFISTGEEPEDPKRVMDRLAGGLADHGWVRLPLQDGENPEEAPDRYRKGQEDLSVTAEIVSSRTLVTWHMAKAAGPVPAKKAAAAATNSDVPASKVP